MEFSWLLMKQISALFIMIFVGYVIVKLKLFKTEDSATFAKLTLYVISPFMVLNACQMEYSHERLVEFFVAFGIGMVINIAYVVVTTLAAKVIRMSGTEQASLIYSNSGNLIIPLVNALIGPQGVFYLCAFLMSQNIVFWTHGISIIGGRDQMTVKKIITNPNIIAIILGITLFVCKIVLPEIPRNAVSQVASTIGPLCMFIIGMLIAGADLKKVFANKRAYLISCGRLIIIPLLTILALWAIGVGNWDERWKAIIIIFVLCFAAPPATNVSQAATVFNNDPEHASVINIMSVIFCIITIPLMTLIYQALCGAV